MGVCAIIAAAGQGVRMGGSKPKQFCEIGAKPILVYTLEKFCHCQLVDRIIIVVPERWTSLVQDNILKRWPISKNYQVIAGGATRQDSVFRALQFVAERDEIIVIHDAVRPLLSLNLLNEVIAKGRETGAAVVAVPAYDSIKIVADSQIQHTISRDSAWLIQTPQVFHRDIIVTAYRQAYQHGISATDDSALVELLGQPVSVVTGSRQNFKITTPEDFELAELLLKATSPQKAIRVGIGYDVHRLVPGRKLILAGVDIPHPKGLLGHSDADVVCHAIGDALLGAAGLADIGSHFPSTDDRYRNISSLGLLDQIFDLLHNAHYEIINIDVTIIAEQPAINPIAEAMKTNLARALHIDLNQISIKATTQEGLGAIGRGEGIAAHAVCLIQKH